MQAEKDITLLEKGAESTGGETTGVTIGSDSIISQHHRSDHHQQHHQAQSTRTAEGSGSTTLAFGLGTTLQTRQCGTASHQQIQTIPTIPEEHSTTGLGQGALKANVNGPHPEVSSKTTTTASSTPSSTSSSDIGVSNMSDHASAPEFPTSDNMESSSTRILQGRGGAHHGSNPDETSWQSLTDGMITSRYEPATTTSSSATAEVAKYPESSPIGQPQYVQTTFPSAIKLLVSNNVAGSIIGRAGQTISELQAQSTTRIKLSQTGDYYPGTQDRVCLVQGQLENVKTAVSLLLDRLYMLQEHQHSQHIAWQSNKNEGTPLSFDFVVRLLVPSSSCGMIIGKSGSNIRQMEEVSGVSSVRLSPKESTDPNYPSAAIVSATSERIVTLTGSTLESCRNCLFIILDGMTTHPDICRYSNMTTGYSRLISPDTFPQTTTQVRVGVPPTTVVSRQQQQGQTEASPWEAGAPGISPHYQQQNQGGLSRRVSSSPDLAGVLLNQRVAMPPPQEQRAAPVSPHVGRDNITYSTLFGSGPSYTPQLQQQQGASRVPVPASAAAASPSSAGQPLYLTHVDNGAATQSAAAAAATNIHSSSSAPDLVALQLQEAMHISPTPQQPPPPADYPLFASPHPQAAASTSVFSAQVLVPDNMIGSILGRGGRTLNELQIHSGTRIRVSQRGEYFPGTRNRIVTIRGPTSQSVSLAQYMMSQRMILPRTAAYQQQHDQQQLRQQQQQIHSHHHHQQQDSSHHKAKDKSKQAQQGQHPDMDTSSHSTKSNRNNNKTSEHTPS